MQEENGRFQQEIGELKGMHNDFEKIKSIQEQLERLQTGTSHQTSAVLKVLLKS